MISNLRLFRDEQDESKDGDREAEVHDDRGGHGRRLHALDDEVLRTERRQEEAEVNFDNLRRPCKRARLFQIL